jgi:hypothetical protein
LRAPEKQLNNDIYVVSSYIFEIYVIRSQKMTATVLYATKGAIQKIFLKIFFYFKCNCNKRAKWGHDRTPSINDIFIFRSLV